MPPSAAPSPAILLALLLPVLPMADVMPTPAVLQRAPIGASPREQAEATHAAAHAAALRADFARAEALYSLSARLYVDLYGSDQHPALAGLWAERRALVEAQQAHSPR